MGRMLDSLYAVGVIRTPFAAFPQYPPGRKWKIVYGQLPDPILADRFTGSSYDGALPGGGQGGPPGLCLPGAGLARGQASPCTGGVMGLVCADTGGIPLFFPLRTGTLRTARPWWTWCPGTGRPWILRVPATLREAKALLGEEVLRRLLARRFACERDARRALGSCKDLCVRVRV